MATATNKQRESQSLVKTQEKIARAITSLRAKVDEIAKEDERQRRFAEKAIYELQRKGV